LEHYIQNVYLHKFRALKALLDVATEQDPRDILAWFGACQLLRDMRNLLVRLHAWAVPSKQAIELIARYSPLVEVCAGTGYWAFLLKLAGADVVAYDLEPRPFQGEDRYEEGHSWTEVLQGTAEEALAQHPGRTLFLCWPPAGDPVAEIALRATQAEYVIYVGWKDDDVTGSIEFHQLLASHWQLVETVDIPQWPEMRDRLFVYRRR